MTLVDRIIPAEALRWGRLTHEPYAWHEDRLRYVWEHTRRAIVAPLLPVIERLVVVLGRSPEGGER